MFNCGKLGHFAKECRSASMYKGGKNDYKGGKSDSKGYKGNKGDVERKDDDNKDEKSGGAPTTTAARTTAAIKAKYDDDESKDCDDHIRPMLQKDTKAPRSSTGPRKISSRV